MSVKKIKAGAKRRLVLLDSHAILHRAYHALPDFTSPTGEPTGALYGLSSMLLKIIGDLQPDYVVATFDLPEATYRHEVYEGYKAGRAKTDDALSLQIDRSRDVFAAFGIPIYEKSGFEADDMLGTIVHKVRNEKDLEVVIASGDMDTLQLVSGSRVRVYTLKKGIKDTIIYDEKGVLGRFGFPPKLLPDFKGLRGDPSDNIIGIPGIGEKTATDLIVGFGSLESIYKQLKKSETPFLEKGIRPRIIDLLKNHEEEALFSKALATIRTDAPIGFVLPDVRFADAIDTGKITALWSELGFRTLGGRLKELFGGEGQMISFDETPKEVIDPRMFTEAQIALWLLESDHTNPTLEDILERTKTTNLPSALDVLEKRLRTEKLDTVYREIELPLIPVLSRMYERGITIDTTFLEQLGREYREELERIEKRIFTEAGEEFNINSPKQLGVVLFDKMGLVVKNQKKTGTGQKSTKESELEKLRDAHPIIADIFAYRELQKLLGTYIEPIPKMVDAEGRLHAEFLQTGTTTGRMSSQNPNLQNIPIRTDLGRRIRNAFVATPGYTLVSLDYSQIELRIAAFLSEDAKLIEIFKGGGDIHRAVAAEVFGVPPQDVDPEMRRRAKVINFGILYGMGVTALQSNLGTSRAEAQSFYDEYFKNFSGLGTYLEKTKAFALKHGYTETFFGRKRRFEGIRSPLPYIRAQAERMAINAPIQGTQADIIKIAMARIDAYLVGEKLERDAYMLLQVHDELVFEISEEYVARIVPEIKNIMEGVLSASETHGVPILVESKAGSNWGSMEK